MAANPAAATAPARVPSVLTAPSVPLGTRCSVVIRYVVCPYAWPHTPKPYLKPVPLPCTTLYLHVTVCNILLQPASWKRTCIENQFVSHNGACDLTHYMCVVLDLCQNAPACSFQCLMHQLALTLPISEDTVSDSLLTKLATKPMRQGSSVPVASAATAQTMPASPEPHTLPCVTHDDLPPGMDLHCMVGWVSSRCLTCSLTE